MSKFENINSNSLQDSNKREIGSISKPFYILHYSHETIQELLDKIYYGEVLTRQEYAILLHKGFENLSTFSGSYIDLIDKPFIPKKLSDLNIDMSLGPDEETFLEMDKKVDSLRVELNEAISNNAESILFNTEQINSLIQSIANLILLQDKAPENNNALWLDPSDTYVEDNDSHPYILELRAIYNNFYDRNDKLFIRLNNLVIEDKEDALLLLELYRTIKSDISILNTKINSLQIPSGINSIKDFISGIKDNLNTLNEIITKYEVNTSDGELPDIPDDDNDEDTQFAFLCEDGINPILLEDGAMLQIEY